MPPTRFTTMCCRALAILLPVLVLIQTLDVDDARAQLSPFQIGNAPNSPAPAGGVLGVVGAWQQQAYQALRTATVALSSGDTTAFTSLLLLAFTYGVVHAAGPGHGKVVISSYLLAEGRNWRQGMLLSLMAALAQGITALLLVTILFALLNLSSIDLDRWVLRFEAIAFGAMAVVGLLLIMRAWRGLQSAKGDRDGPPHGEHGHGRHHHDHEHCGHNHGPIEADTWREALGAVLVIGIRPCTGSLLLLVFCLSQGLLWAGAFGVAAVSLGTALTTSLLALLAVGGHHALLRRIDGTKARLMQAALRAGAGATLTVLGVLLLLATLR